MAFPGSTPKLPRILELGLHTFTYNALEPLFAGIEF
jgi:hypothetical protein